MPQYDSAWLDNAVHSAANAALENSELWGQFLGAAEFAYLYTALEHQERTGPSTVVLQESAYLVPAFRPLWEAREEAIAKCYTPEHIKNTFRQMHLALLTMPEIKDHAQGSQERITTLLDNDNVTTAMFAPLLAHMQPWTKTELKMEFDQEPVWSQCADCGKVRFGKIIDLAYFQNIKEYGVVIKWESHKGHANDLECDYRKQDYLIGAFKRSRYDPDD